MIGLIMAGGKGTRMNSDNEKLLLKYKKPIMLAEFGSTELGLGTINLIVTVLLIQVVAIFGAWFFSNLSHKYGNFKALKINTSVTSLAC